MYTALLVPARAGIFKQSMGARNRGVIGLLYRPARLHRLVEFIPLESIPGLHKRLKILALDPPTKTISGAAAEAVKPHE
jgi:hypothetical protein